MPNRPNPAKLNALQLKTLAILQEQARSEGGASEALDDGSVALNRLPRPHGDHFHVGKALVMAKDATGLGNPAVFNALHRKGLLTRAPDGRPALTAEAIAYETGIESSILHRSDH